VIATKIIANLPAVLAAPVERAATVERYPNRSDYAVGCIVWDLYSRQPHNVTGRLTRIETERFAEGVAAELGEDIPRMPMKPWRYPVSIPEPLLPIVNVRWREVPYRSASAYICGVVLYALKVRDPDPKTNSSCPSGSWRRSWCATRPTRLPSPK